MTKQYMLCLALCGQAVLAQVGVNTTTPEATLDVNGNLIVRQVNDASAATSYDFLVQNSTTNEVEKVSGTLGNASADNTIAKVAVEDGLSLLSIAVSDGWQQLDFGASNIRIDRGSNFSAVTNSYTVPSSGIYQVIYELKYSSGVLAEILNFEGTPSIGILQNRGGVYSVLDQRTFSGANVPVVLSILISDSRINSFYELTAGDEISFALREGGLSLNLLDSSIASAIIRKISD